MLEVDIVGWLWVVWDDVDFGENGKVVLKSLVMYYFFGLRMMGWKR